MCGPCTVGLCTDALFVQTMMSKGGNGTSTTRPTTAAHMELVSDLKLRRYQRARYATYRGKTFALCKRYREGNLTSTLTGLLKAFSCLYKPVTPKMGRKAAKQSSIKKSNTKTIAKVTKKSEK
ncbi:hypothetical protein DPMN_004441 [Dreissena polymorpha]|uniref:Uncharacterized protein n=1 Tax=Dreissena polymorpha TaxID=45954 RepID=A0A9D4MQT6_DREPO|nr:hypothetical protein DPMN_004441 [Dreissena polymorpha]